MESIATNTQVSKHPLVGEGETSVIIQVCTAYPSSVPHQLFVVLYVPKLLVTNTNSRHPKQRFVLYKYVFPVCVGNKSLQT